MLCACDLTKRKKNPSLAKIPELLLMLDGFSQTCKQQKKNTKDLLLTSL